jgi:hypothetical protein
MSLPEKVTFTEDEWIAAFSLILPPDRAREEGLVWSAPDNQESEGEMTSPWSYDGDILDLLSLVSESCAERAWRLLRVTREEGERRRAEFRSELENALRAQRKAQDEE